MKKLARVASALLLCVMVFSFCMVPASAVTTSSFNANGSSNGYCEVRISDKLLNKKGKQYAKVTLKTCGLFGWSTSGKFIVTMKDEYGNVIWSGQKTCSTTLSLGDDHRVYRIYVTCANNEFINVGKCVTWKIENAKDCSIS